MTGLFLSAIALLAAAIAFVTNWLALIPWRRATGQHWAECARVYHPARTAAAGNLWALPAVLTLLSLLLLPDESPHWVLILLAAVLGTIVGTLPMDREVFPRIPLTQLLRQVLMGWMMRFMMWAVFLGAIALMPDAFTPRAFIIGAAICGLGALWDLAGLVWVGRGIGLFRPPEGRLQGMVHDLADRMHLSVREIWVLRVSLAQAFAMPGSKRLLVSERLLELLSDDELEAICAHELAHLTEARRDYFKRYVAWLIILPWVFFKPTLETFGFLGMFPLTLISLGSITVLRRTSLKLERRADRLAVSSEPDPGTYARALGRIYEDSLIPVATSKQHATHPDLYDRWLAAGVVPNFPRPKAAKSISWNGQLCAGALGVLIVLHIISLTDFL